MSTTTRVIKNTGFLYIKMGVTVFISLYTTRLILASLGASDFGVFNIVGGAITMLGFLNCTMVNVTQRFMSYAEGAGDLVLKRKVFNVSFVLHVGIATATAIILLAAMYPFFHGILNIPHERLFAAEMVYVCTLISTLLTIINVPYDAVMNAHENMLYYSLIGIFESILRLAVALAVVTATGDKLIVYGALTALIPLVTLSIMKVYCHRKYDECVFGIRTYWDGSLVKRIASFFSWNFLTAISSLASFYGGNVVVNHFFGTVANAAQGIASQINGQLSNLSLNLMKAVNPIITKRAGSGDVEAMNRASLQGSRYSTLLIVLFSVPFILEMHYVLSIWLKEVPEWTTLFCAMQLVVTVVCQMASSQATAIYAEGHIKWYAIYKSLMNFLPVVATYAAFALGAAPYWFYIFMILIWSIGGDMVIVHYARTLCHLRVMDFVRIAVMPVMAVSALMFAGGYVSVSMLPEGFIRLIVTCCVTTLIFGLSIWFLVLTKHDRERVVKAIKKRRNRKSSL